MKAPSSTIVACLVFIFTSMVSAAQADAVDRSPGPGKDNGDSRQDAAGDLASADLWPTFNGTDDDAAGARGKADRARAFYNEFPGHRKAAEARRLEAVFLIDAVRRGDMASKDRMESTVRALRGDASVPAVERAIVAGTYEFHTAGQRVRSMAQLQREYEDVARGLIREFPDQPQGYVSLLTQAQQWANAAKARAMAVEVLDATAAPAEARQAARRLVTRFDLVGQPLEEVLPSTILRAGETGGWKKDRPGLIYFWATWSPDSVALGEQLKARLSADANVLSICLDVPNGELELGTMEPRPDPIDAAAPKLPGRVVKLASGMSDAVAERLGASSAPLIYLVGADGRVSDVRGFDGLEAKLTTLGF